MPTTQKSPQRECQDHRKSLSENAQTGYFFWGGCSLFYTCILYKKRALDKACAVVGLKRAVVVQLVSREAFSSEIFARFRHSRQRFLRSSGILVRDFLCDSGILVRDFLCDSGILDDRATRMPGTRKNRQRECLERENVGNENAWNAKKWATRMPGTRKKWATRMPKHKNIYTARMPRR